MRLALVSSRYFPESSPGAKRAAELVASLRAAAHDVTVLTQLPPGAESEPARGQRAGKRPVIESDSDGVEVWRFPPEIVAKGNLPRRLMAEARFARLTSRRRTKISEVDGVVASTPFVFNLLAARSYRVPMWLDVRDLTWEYVRELGSRSVAKSIGAAALRRLAIRTLRNARGVSTTTDGQREYLIQQGLRAERVHVVPNGVPRDVIDALLQLTSTGNGRATSGDPTAEIPESETLKSGPPKVVYAGLLGFPQGLQFAVDTVAGMKNDEVELHLYGDGVDRPALVERCLELGAPHVHVHAQVPYEEYLRVLAGADVLLASLRPEVQAAVPSKVLEYMAAGKPVLFIGKGEGADVVEQVNAGVAVPYGDATLLEERLRELARDSRSRRELGENGRRWVTQYRVREALNRSWVGLIEEALGTQVHRKGGVE